MSALKVLSSQGLSHLRGFMRKIIFLLSVFTLVSCGKNSSTSSHSVWVSQDQQPLGGVNTVLSDSFNRSSTGTDWKPFAAEPTLFIANGALEAPANPLNNRAYLTLTKPLGSSKFHIRQKVTRLDLAGNGVGIGLRNGLDSGNYLSALCWNGGGAQISCQIQESSGFFSPSVMETFTTTDGEVLMDIVNDGQQLTLDVLNPSTKLSLMNTIHYNYMNPPYSIKYIGLNIFVLPNQTSSRIDDLLIEIF